MPQASQETIDEFENHFISREPCDMEIDAQKYLKSIGWKHRNGMFTLTPEQWALEDPKAWAAINYLMEEWDWDYRKEDK